MIFRKSILTKIYLCIWLLSIKNVTKISGDLPLRTPDVCTVLLHWESFKIFSAARKSLYESKKPCSMCKKCNQHYCCAARVAWHTRKSFVRTLEKWLYTRPKVDNFRVIFVQSAEQHFDFPHEKIQTRLTIILNWINTRILRP